MSGAHRECSDVDRPAKTRLTVTWTTSLNDQEQVFPLYRLTQPEKKKKTFSLCHGIEEARSNDFP